MNPRLSHLLMLLLGLVFLAACGAEPGGEPDPVATQVAIERAAAATLTAEALAAAPPAATATPTDTPADPATPTPVPPTPAVEPPTPTPTQIEAVVFPVDGSDPDGNQALHGSFIQSNGGRNLLLPGISQAQVTEPMVFAQRLPVRVQVFDETVGNSDGDGIAAVEFQITGPNGDRVLQSLEETAPYCLWTGNDPACPAPTFAELGYRWPQTGEPIENGSYSATILITADDESSAVWFWSFEIAHGGQTAAPVEVVLRPACGDEVTVPANTPIDLIYGIWAARGAERAAANQYYIAIELNIGNNSFDGEEMGPVDHLPQIICGSDYEDSYWVYHTLRLAPLAPGVYPVRVTYRFSGTVEDGWGDAYAQPFTQQYVITVE